MTERSPFATTAMAALRDRLANGANPTPPPAPKRTRRGHRGGAKRRPDLDTLRVWNGNEGPTLEQLVAAVPPAGGVAGLVEDITSRMEPTPMADPPRRPERRERRDERDKPRRPFTDHVRELTMPDGRRLIVDRRAVGFICEAKPDEASNGAGAIVAFRTLARPCPVIEPYTDVRDWWVGKPALAGNEKVNT